MIHDLHALLRKPDLLRADAIINGEWVPANFDRKIEILNPATGQVIAAVPRLGALQA